MPRDKFDEQFNAIFKTQNQARSEQASPSALGSASDDAEKRSRRIRGQNPNWVDRPFAKRNSPTGG